MKTMKQNGKKSATAELNPRPKGGDLVERLVRQVSRALKKTKRMMFWDIEPDEDDIRDRLGGFLKDSYTAREAVESVIEGMLHSHQETLCNAARDQCNCATKSALAYLPNDSSAPTT